jgi:hypothetical protein
MRLLALFFALLLLDGCGTDPQVAALRADPMGGWSHPGVHQVNEIVTEPGTTLGKPHYAGILRVLETQGGTSVVSALREVRKAAREAGWTVTYLHADGAFSAEKPFTVEGEKLRGTLSAGRQDIGDDPGAPDIYLALRAYPA